MICIANAKETLPQKKEKEVLLFESEMITGPCFEYPVTSV